MKGNFHVQFLGGWGAAMLPGYPAGAAATSPPYPAIRLSRRVPGRAAGVSWSIPLLRSRISLVFAGSVLGAWKTDLPCALRQASSHALIPEWTPGPSTATCAAQCSYLV